MNNQFPSGPSAQPTSLRLECFVWYCLVFYFKLYDLKNIFNTTMIQCIIMKGTQYHEFKILMFEWTICWLYLIHIDHTFIMTHLPPGSESLSLSVYVFPLLCLLGSWLLSYLQAALEPHTPHTSRIPSIIFIGSCLLVSFFLTTLLVKVSWEQFYRFVIPGFFSDIHLIKMKILNKLE